MCFLALPECILGVPESLLRVSWASPGCLLGVSWASWVPPGCLLVALGARDRQGGATPTPSRTPSYQVGSFAKRLCAPLPYAEGGRGVQGVRGGLASSAVLEPLAPVLQSSLAPPVESSHLGLDLPRWLPLSRGRRLRLLKSHGRSTWKHATG